MKSRLAKGTMVRCVICGGEREAYKDCASCAAMRAAGVLSPELTPEQRRAARRLGVVTLATSDAFPEATRQHVAKYLHDQADKLTSHRAGRKDGIKNKKTPRVEALFDGLYRDNPNCTVDEIQNYKGPKSVKAMSRATVARHWKKAKERAAQ